MTICPNNQTTDRAMASDFPYGEEMSSGPRHEIEEIGSFVATTALHGKWVLLRQKVFPTGEERPTTMWLRSCNIGAEERLQP